MLGKLMKYELKVTSRWFLPLYAAIIFFAILNRVLLTNINTVENVSHIRAILSMLSIFLYGALFVGIMVITLVVVIQRFYKNLLGEEGYLMFTLPVQSWKHILNKLLIAMLWSFLSIVVAFGSILLMVPAEEIREIVQAFGRIPQAYTAALYLISPLMIIVSLVFDVITLYLAITLGHLFSKHKLLASFGMYLAINTAIQLLSILLLFALEGFMDSFISFPTPEQINLFLIGVTVFMAAMAAISYFVTNILLKKKLNLE